MRKYRQYTDEDIIQNAKDVYSLSQLLEKLDLKKAGGNFAHMKKTLQRLKVDCKHWTGQGWNKGEQLKDWKDYNKVSSIKPHLITMRTHSCENCKQTEWMGKKIPLEVDHIDGDRTNNEYANLKLLCCNCHALTPTWRGRKNNN